MNRGVPQGSILGPSVFHLYMLPHGNIIRRRGIKFRSYADDTQLYVAVSPDDSAPIDAPFNCILGMKLWMAESFFFYSSTRKLMSWSLALTLKSVLQVGDPLNQCLGK